MMTITRISKVLVHFDVLQLGSFSIKSTFEIACVRVKKSVKTDILQILV